MLVKILGFIDIISAIALMMGTQSKLPLEICLILGVILILKSSLGFLKDFGSWIDIIGGLIFLILILIKVPTIILVIIIILLFQKGIISFLK